MRPLLPLVPLLSAVLLASCGGGGGGESDAFHSSFEAAPAPAADVPNDPVPVGTTPSPSEPATAPSSPSAPQDAPSQPSPSSALNAATTCGLPDFQKQVMERVNQARAMARSCGTTAYPAAAPLSWNDKLFAAAAGHAEDMARQQYFSHTSLDGRTLGERVSEAGYAWSAVGENIAAGQRDVNQVIDAWLQSAGHCANIMQSRYAEIAVACVAGTDHPYWVMSLAKPR